MIICLGPICFPIWQLIPVLLLLLAKAKVFWYWLIGKPMPISNDEKKQDGDAETVAMVSDDSQNEALRQRKAQGVLTLTSIEKWRELVRASAASGEPVVVDFTAKWCKPCKEIAPFFEELCAKYSHKATFVVVDINDLEDLAEECRVSSLPTFQVYKGEKKLGEMTGGFKDDLRSLVQKHCA